MPAKDPDPPVEVRPFNGRPRTVRTPQGELWNVPDDWELLEPGDPALTRRVKAAGDCWVVRELRRGKFYSHGVWAPAERIATLREALTAEREDPGYARRLEAGRARRARAEEAYGESFHAAVLAYLDFAPRHSLLAAEMARRIVAHAVPVGSGTVARTQRIPLEQRAEAATIAWMRHQTTGYDTMEIPRGKGARREVRRLLAARSKSLLARYRSGGRADPAHCPLVRALRETGPVNEG